ncbi:MAG: hypothetical protein PHI93_11745 [Kiritimatiellae bacterium]|nr:hypothetical protein [Kiritimatiellia bacterium]
MKDQLQALNERLTAAGFESVKAVPGKTEGSINLHLRNDQELMKRISEDLIAEQLQADEIRLFSAIPHDVLILENVRPMPKPEATPKKAKKNV